MDQCWPVGSRPAVATPEPGERTCTSLSPSVLAPRLFRWADGVGLSAYHEVMPRQLARAPLITALRTCDLTTWNRSASFGLG